MRVIIEMKYAIFQKSTKTFSIHIDKEWKFRNLEKVKEITVMNHSADLYMLHALLKFKFPQYNALHYHGADLNKVVLEASLNEIEEVIKHYDSLSIAELLAMTVDHIVIVDYPVDSTTYKINIKRITLNEFVNAVKIAKQRWISDYDNVAWPVLNSSIRDFRIAEKIREWTGYIPSSPWNFKKKKGHVVLVAWLKTEFQFKKYTEVIEDDFEFYVIY